MHAASSFSKELNTKKRDYAGDISIEGKILAKVSEIFRMFPIGKTRHHQCKKGGFEGAGQMFL